MSSAPRVSIAMPAYNCEKYIGRSLESLLSQTYSDFELVISDNASTDATEQICREYATRDSRIRYVRRPDNIGGPGNFRHVFSLCSGEYHKWSTADDYWDPTFLARCVEILDTRPDVVLCYSKTRLVNSAGECISEYEDNLDLQQESPRARFNALFERIGLCNAHLGLIRRSAMSRTRLIGPELASDVHFLAELTFYGKFSLLTDYLFFRRYHEQSSSWNRTEASRQKKYYDPKGVHRVQKHTWRKFGGLFRAALRAPLPIGERVMILADITRMARWSRHDLARELRWPGSARMPR